MSTLNGKLCRLRPIVNDDLQLLHRWLNDPEIMMFWDGRDHPATFDRVEARFRRSIEGSDRDAHRWMIEVPEGDGVATIGMIQHGRVDPRARNAQVDVLIGEPRFRDTGFGGDALFALLEHLFEAQKLRRVWFTIRAGNERAITAGERAGFAREGVLREHNWLEGKLVDVIVFGMLAREWPAAKAGWQA